MIRVGPGAGFTTAVDGDMRTPGAAAALGLGEWATVHQVHGSEVRVVGRPGDHGDGDAMVTSATGLPLAVFTADCLGLVLHGPGRVAVVHAGWRGLAAGVVEAAVAAMDGVESVAIGPHIRPCCFEVGPEVADRFPRQVARTTWGTVSVDLTAAAAEQLPVEPQVVGSCTRCGPDAFSHRRDATRSRMAAIGWLT